MKKIPLPILLFGLMFLAGYAGFFVFQWMHDPKPDSETVEKSAGLVSATDMLLIGLSRPDFEMKDLDGEVHSVSEWDGKVLVLNFWAPWCTPCKKEIPVFNELQEKYAGQGLQFVGLAVDTPEEVKNFLKKMPLKYPTLVGEDDAMDIAKIYGNNIGAIPYTVMINRSGKIAFTRKGDMKKAEAEKIFSAMMNQ